MFRLQTYDVIVGVRKTDAFSVPFGELLGLAVYEADEVAEYQGMVELHWRFNELREAESVADALNALCQRPELVLLRISNYDDADGSIIFKDERDRLFARNISRSAAI